MAGDYTGCSAIIRKKSTSSSQRSHSQNGSGGRSSGTNSSEGQRSVNGGGEGQTKNNESNGGGGGGGKSRRIFDNINGGGKSSSSSSAGGVLVPVTHYKDPLKTYKIVILGDGGVGKSAVTLQFVRHSFQDFHDPTIEDAYQQQAVIDGEAALLDILDTAGQVEFTAMRDQYMRCGEGFIICYSVTDRRSFQEASEYRKLIERVRLTQDIPLVLIANKLDLQHQRTVSTEEGKLLASEFGCPFFETSACLRHFIDDVFHTLVREIRRKQEMKRDSDSLSQSPSSISIEKMDKKRSRWWRIRSIFALVFRRKRHLN